MREGGTFDKELLLRDSGGAAITATTAEAAIAMKGKYFGDMKAVINVEEFDNTTTDESYLIEVTVCDTVGGTYKTVATLLSATLKAAGYPFKHELGLLGNTMEDVVAGAAFVKIKATLGGSSPSLKYNAFLARNV